MQFDVLSDGLIQASALLFLRLVNTNRPQVDGFVKGKLMLLFRITDFSHMILNHGLLPDGRFESLLSPFDWHINVIPVVGHLTDYELYYDLRT